MERRLKYHEKKLLRKTDFMDWDKGKNIKQIEVLRRYHIQKREDYTKYNKISKNIRKLFDDMTLLAPDDPFRIKMTEQIIEKLHSMALIPTKQYQNGASVSASSFCRRRLAVILVRNHFCEQMKQATLFIEHGHIRIGPNVITDPAYFVTRSMEDFITWTDTSKIKKKVLSYNDKLDDYDFLGS